MAQWGSKDASSNAVLWGPAKLHLAPNTANRNELYANVTADAFITGRTDGMFAVDAAKMAVGRNYLSAVAINGVGTGGSYVPGEILTPANTGATLENQASAVVVSTKVRTVTANAATGTGYANGDTLTCNTGVMTTNAIFTVTTGASNTSVASLTLTTNGVFTTNPTLADGFLTAVTGVGTGAKATLTMRVNALSVANPGRYSVVPTDVTTNPLSGSVSGTGANATLTFTKESLGVTHTGWVLRTLGSGGRAGRETNEVLVAGGITSENSSSNSVFHS